MMFGVLKYLGGNSEYASDQSALQEIQFEQFASVARMRWDGAEGCEQPPGLRRAGFDGQTILIAPVLFCFV